MWLHMVHAHARLRMVLTLSEWPRCAAMFSLSRASQIKLLLYRRSCLLLSPPPDQPFLSHFIHLHVPKATQTHKLRWHASARKRMRARTPAHLCYRHEHLPKQAVTHMFMPVINVGNPSMWLAAKMEVQKCSEDGVHMGHLGLIPALEH